MEGDGFGQKEKMDRILDAEFLRQMEAYCLTEDQAYNALYYVLYIAGTQDIQEAFLDAAGDGFPYNADEEECRFGRRLAVMAVMLDMEMKKNLDMQQKLLALEETGRDVHGCRNQRRGTGDKD